MNAAKRFELVAFDMDGVLVDFHSSWVWVHRYFGTCNDHSLDSYMAGDIDDREFIRRDLEQWMEVRPRIHTSDIAAILDDIPLMPGLAATISALKERGIRCVIISGGIDILTDRLVSDHGFDAALSNSLCTDQDGFLTGEGHVGVKLNDKATPLLELQEKYGLSPGHCASVGNSSIDVSMFEHSGLSIAFNPEGPYVVRNADRVVYRRDLGDILRYLI